MKIENLSAQKKLNILSLKNNLILKMENLTDLVELKELNLSKNKITIFEGVL